MSNPSLRRTTPLAAALAIVGAMAGIQNPISETRSAADERRYITVVRDRSQKQRKDGPTVDRGKRRAKNKQARQSRAKNRR